MSGKKVFVDHVEVPMSNMTYKMLVRGSEVANMSVERFSRGIVENLEKVLRQNVVLLYRMVHARRKRGNCEVEFKKVHK